MISLLMTTDGHSLMFIASPKGCYQHPFGEPMNIRKKSQSSGPERQKPEKVPIGYLLKPYSLPLGYLSYRK